METLREFIATHCLTTTGKIKACIYKDAWWLQNGFAHYKTSITSVTSLLPESATLLQRFYHILNGIDSIPQCPVCANQTKWYGAGNRYNTYCSKQCSALASKSKRTATSLEKYGVENPSQSLLVKAAIKQTTLKNHGVDNFAKGTEFKKIRAHQLDSLTTEQREQVKRRRQSTCMQKYGAESTVAAKAIQEKIAATMQSKYGVAKPLQVQEFKQTQQRTNLARFNREHWAQQHIPTQTIEHLKDAVWVETQLKEKSIHCLAIDLGISFSQLCKIVNKHGLMPHNYSSFHREVLNFITTLGITNVICNDRTTLQGKEIDILIPDLNIGIECNGVYWHSEIAGRKDPKYHLSKTRAAAASGIRLLHIFDSEWFGAKRPLIEGKIRNILFKTSKKVGARHCKIIDATTAQERAFIGENHLQGYVASSHCIALAHNGELVAVMSFTKPRYTTKHQWELLRYCTATNCTVQGGFSKLFKYFVGVHGITEVLSYCDRRWSVGNVYSAAGFTLSHESPPAYYYHSDGKTLHNRSKFQKHKLSKLLESFNPDLTEWQNMQNNGYDRIWDCGTLAYIWKNNK